MTHVTGRHDRGCYVNRLHEAVKPIMPRAPALWHPVGAMFISVKRHEREKQELLNASNRLTDAILKTSSIGLFLMDSKGKIQPQVSASLEIGRAHV